MEIILKSSSTNKKINVDNSIVSIQTLDKKIINNLVNDYGIIQIDYCDNYFIGETVLEEINLYNKYPDISLVNYLLKIFELDNKFLDRNISTLSLTEKIYLNIIRNISSNEKIIFFKNIFLGLDLKNIKIIIKLINFLKENSYIIFYCSDDVDNLYKYSDFSIVANENFIEYDKTDSIYTNVEFLVKYEFDIPTLSYITYIVKKEKNIKLFYSKDVRDIIKDIYKHV